MELLLLSQWDYYFQPMEVILRLTVIIKRSLADVIILFSMSFSSAKKMSDQGWASPKFLIGYLMYRLIGIYSYIGSDYLNSVKPIWLFCQADAVSNEKPISDWLMKKERNNLSLRGVRPDQLVTCCADGYFLMGHSGDYFFSGADEERTEPMPR